MILEHFLIAEVNETNVYLIGCARTRRAALVDAGGFDRRVVDAVARHGLSLETILITHDHYDHTGGLADYLGAFPGARVLAGRDQVGGCVSTALADGDTFAIGRLSVRVLAIPGHTAESLAFHLTLDEPDEVPLSVVFLGDILFAGSVGGTASEKAQESEIRGIREKIFTLSDATGIYPGHGPATTVGVEKHGNPFFV